MARLRAFLRALWAELTAPGETRDPYEDYCVFGPLA